MNVLKHTIKKFIYGTLPYYFMKGYKPGSPYLKYYEYIKEHGYSRHLYEFKDEYANMMYRKMRKKAYTMFKKKRSDSISEKALQPRKFKNIIGL